MLYLFVFRSDSRYGTRPSLRDPLQVGTGVSSPMRLIPNIITIGRLIMVPVTVYCILTGELTVAFWLFVAAGVSDAVDGAIARLCDAQTLLGAFLDPLADKALLVSVYLSLC